MNMEHQHHYYRSSSKHDNPLNVHDSDNHSLYHIRLHVMRVLRETHYWGKRVVPWHYTLDLFVVAPEVLPIEVVAPMMGLHRLGL